MLSSLVIVLMKGRMMREYVPFGMPRWWRPWHRPFTRAEVRFLSLIRAGMAQMRDCFRCWFKNYEQNSANIIYVDRFE